MSLGTQLSKAVSPKRGTSDLQEKAAALSIEIEVLGNIPDQFRPQAERELAEMRVLLAFPKLQAGDADGWIDLFDAITRFAMVGEITRAEELIGQGRKLVSSTPNCVELMSTELARIAEWVSIRDNNSRHGSADQTDRSN